LEFIFVNSYDGLLFTFVNSKGQPSQGECAGSATNAGLHVD
jgi:hypothetical protein